MPVSENLSSRIIGSLFLGFLACGLSQYSPLWTLAALFFLSVPPLLIGLRVWSDWKQTQQVRALKLDDVDMMPGRQFEHYVARLLEHQGFRTTVTKGSGDLGVDIIAHRDGQSYCVQCKRYNAN